MPAPAESLAVGSFEAAGTLGVLRWSGLAALGVDALVTTRRGGVSAGPYGSLNLGLHVGDEPASVLENRRRAAGALGASLDDLVLGAQVHGVRAAVVGPGEAGRGARSQADALEATDALVTSSTAPVLVTLVADCSPILLVDPVARVLATVHAGWRGAVGDIAGTVVATMASLGGRAERMHAVVGPTVPFAGYEVGPDVAHAASAALGHEARSVLLPRGDRWRFDVAGANRLLLVSAGLPASQVHLTPYGTDDPRFFSDRAERPCGRFGLLARLRPAEGRP